MTVILAPSTDNAKDLLADTAAGWMRISALTKALLNAQIGELDNNPTWLADAHKALAANRTVGEQWLNAAPDIKAPVIGPFIQYGASFQAFAQLARSTDHPPSVAELIEYLQDLSNTIDDILSGMGQGTQKLAGIVQAFADVHEQMSNAAIAAKNAYAQEEAAIIQSAATVASLEQHIEDLGDAINAGLIASGKTIGEYEIDLIYDLFIGEAEVSFVGVGLIVLSVATDVIDLVENSVEIAALLSELTRALQEEATEVQAAIAMQGALTTFSRLNTLYIEMQGPATPLQLLWEWERDKLQLLIEALKGGADPATMPSLQDLTPAQSNWEALTGFAESLQSLTPAAGASTQLKVKG